MFKNNISSYLQILPKFWSRFPIVIGLKSTQRHKLIFCFAHTLARLPAPDCSDLASDTEAQASSVQSSSQQLSIAPTLVVISSDEDTGNQSVASRTRSQRARQRTSAIAPPNENVTNDPPPTSQPTDNNPLTNLQDRQRAPQQQLSRCLEDGTRIDLSLSEISDEEVDYG